MTVLNLLVAMNKISVAVALVLTIGTPAFSAPAVKKPESKTAVKKSSSKKSDEKEKLRDQIKQMCNKAMEIEETVNRDAALELAQKTYDFTLQHFGKDSPEMVWPEFTIGHILGDNKDSKNAIPHFERAHALATKYPNNPCMGAKYIEIWLFKAYIRTGKKKQASALVADTLNELEKANNVEKLQDYALMYMRSNACDEANAVIGRALACCERSNQKQVLPVLQTQISILLRCRRFKEAIPILERKRELLRAKGDQTNYANTVREMGQLSDLAERFEQSSTYYKEALHLFRIQKRDKFEVSKLLQDYSRVQRSLGHVAEADALKKESEDLRFGIK